MNSNNSVPAPPFHCDDTTDLLPYLQGMIGEIKKSGCTRFLSITLETGYSDPLAILEEIHRPGQAVCYLERPATEFSIACGGLVAEAAFSGEKRFSQAKNWANSIFEMTHIVGNHKFPGTGPTLFIAATFESESTREGSTKPLQVFLPRWQVLRKGGQNFIIYNTEMNAVSSPASILEEFKSATNRIKGMRYDTSVACNPRSIKVGPPTEQYDYEEAVKVALQKITRENLSKIVLSRQLRYNTSEELPAFSIAHDLREKFPDCFTFCLSLAKNEIMVGATPETLLRASGSIFETEAIAGSAPRGPSAGKDAQWGKTLLGREKEVLEHRLVIESILRRLRSIGLTDCREGRARLLRLANLQHVRTPVQAKMTEGIHPFDALSALHPTPAMGGTPREVALPLVGKLEKTARGWYSGVTGWLDSRGRGEFVVPIRCGKITPSTLTLYAGAGLVEGSIPAQEKIETDWKLQAMLEVITGRSKGSRE